MHWFGSFLVGGKAVLLKGVKPEWIMDIVSKEKCSIVWLLVPWAQEILDSIDRGDIKLEHYKLDQWRLMHIGAQPVPPSLIKRWKEYFPNHDYDTNYGLSESIGPGCVHLGVENVHKVGAIGKAGYGWQVKNSMVVNYVSAHDNHTLWDKLTISAGNKSLEQRLAMNRLAAAIVMVSKGMVFFQACEEMLRSKPLGNGKYDHNSYMSDDEVNNIDWSVLKAGRNEYNMMQYYKGLIAIRNNIDIFSAKNVDFVTSNLAYDGFKITINDYNGGKAVVIVNPSSNGTITEKLDGEYHMICNGTVSGTTSLGSYNGNISVPACSVVILVTENLLP